MGNRADFVLPESARRASGLYICDNQCEFLSYEFSHARKMIDVFPLEKDLERLGQDPVLSELKNFLSRNPEHKLRIVFRDSAEIEKSPEIMALRSKHKSQCDFRIAREYTGKIGGFTIIDRETGLTTAGSGSDFAFYNAKDTAQNLSEKFTLLYCGGIKIGPR